jgi:peroxiredoxin Q/BCP
MLKKGDMAPDFTATTTNGNTISLHDYQGINNVVLYFYPEDDTSGCTAEACEFRDVKGQLAEVRTVILGVSTDGQESHQAFSEKHGLNFPLLVDSDGAICAAYGVPIDNARARRVTFLIDNDGEIRQVWTDFTPVGHAAQVVAAVEQIAEEDG